MHPRCCPDVNMLNIISVRITDRIQTGGMSYSIRITSPRNTIWHWRWVRKRPSCTHLSSMKKNEGIAKQDDRQDYGGRINVTFKLFDDWFEVRPAVDYRQAKRE